MIKAREWPVRAMYILIAAALAISLFITAAPAHKVSAAVDEVKAEWTIVDTPTMEGFVLAPESTIIDFAYASEGDVTYAVVYAYDEEWDVQTYRLLKSDDGAATWTDLTDTLENQLEDDGYTISALLRVETDNVDPDFVAVALMTNTDELHVYFTTDGGDTFIDAGEVEDGVLTFATGAPNHGFTDLAVSPEVSGKREIAAGGIASDGNAGLFRCTVTGDNPGDWEDATAYAGWDDDPDPTSGPPGPFLSFGVTFLEFSPNYATDKTILVTTVVPAGMPPFDIYLQCGSWGLTAGWNAASTLGIDAVLVMNDAYIIGTPATMYDPRIIAGLTLPSDYNSKNTDTRVLWVWVNYYDYSKAGNPPASQIILVDNDSAYPVGRQVKLGTVWLTNVAYYGTIAEGKAIAGVLGSGTDVVTAAGCEGVQVYRNTGIHNMDICCENWLKACKPPTGETAMAVAYVSQDKAYAVALQGVFDYDEGAWSVSFDDGNTWNQLSLVDTYIHYFSDVAVSPDCNKMWVVSVDPEGCDSVWLKATALPEAEEYSGFWLRVWCGEFTGSWFESGDGTGFIRLPADETAGDTVFLVDYGTNNVYVNDLEGLACWTPITSATLDDIVDLAATDAETLYALDFNGDVAMYDSEGWHEAVDSKVDNGWTIAVHSNNATEVLVGSAWDGQVSYCDDFLVEEPEFTLLDETVPIEYQECDDCSKYDADNGHTTVAFDTYFDTNDVIYAAIEGWYGPYSAGGIYSWVIGESDDWTDLGAYHDYAYTGLLLSYLGGNPFTSADTGGVLYASYKYMDGSYARTGVARSLTPITEEMVCELCPSEWDYLYVGLPDRNTQFEATPRALKMCGCLTPDSLTKLFAVETRHDYNMIDGTYAADIYYDGGRNFVDDVGGAVWTFEDCYAKKQVELVSPADGFVVGTSTCGCCNVPFVIKWDRLCDACCYEIEFAYDAEFTEPYYPHELEGFDSIMVDGFEHYCPGSVVGPAAAANPSAFVGCFFQPESTYYWRVRTVEAGTGQEIHSWWSDAQSFTVAPTAAAGAIELVSPVPGATDVARTNVAFSWHILATADSFDFVLSKNADLSAPVSTKTGLHGTATSYTGTLDYDTSYYWQVTAYNDGAAISTSAIGTFRTVAQTVPVEPVTAPTPFWVWVVIAIGAVLVIVVIVLIFRTRRV